VVYDFLQDDLMTAQSVGIIGTGKMTAGIINYFSDRQITLPNLTIYTTTHERVGEKIGGHPIRSLESLHAHDLLFTATAQPGLVTPAFLEQYQLDNPIIVDLGMPRNCRFPADTNIQLYTLEEIINRAKTIERNAIITSAYTILHDELKQIQLDLTRQENAERIKQLRQDMLQVAMDKKDDFVQQGTPESKKFDQFVRKLIHVSQQHLEQYIIPEDLV